MDTKYMGFEMCALYLQDGNRRRVDTTQHEADAQTCGLFLFVFVL